MSSEGMNQHSYSGYASGKVYPGLETYSKNQVGPDVFESEWLDVLS